MGSRDWVRRTRGGFLLPSAALIGFVILGLAGMYFLAMRHQDTRGRRFRGGLIARSLAQAAVKAVAHRVRVAADPSIPLDDERRPTAGLRALLRHPARDLPRVLEPYAPKRPGLLSRGDHRPLLKDLLGEGAVEDLDRLEASFPDASLYVTLDFRPEPFPQAPAWLADSSQKAMTVVIVAEARAGTKREVAATCESLVVYPLEAPLVSKFTTDRGYAWHEPGREFPQYPFDTSRPDQPLVAREVEAGTLAGAFAEKGWVLPRLHRLRPGGGVGGQHHLLWKPVDEAVPIPSPRDFPESPRSLADPVVDPLHPELEQRAWVRGLVQAEARDPQLLLGGAPGEEELDAPRLEATVFETTEEEYTAPCGSGVPRVVTGVGESPFGTTLDPSPTFAPASRLLLRGVAAVVLDRDREGADERAQLAEVGVDLPRREGVAYHLFDVPQDRFTIATALEGVDRGEPRPAYLPVVPEEVPNRNLEVDLDGDGHPETRVTQEEPYETLGLRGSYYDPLRVFPDPEELQRYASRDVVLPLNWAMGLAPRDVDASQELLRAFTWEGVREVARSYREVPLALEHRDPVHRGTRGGDSDPPSAVATDRLHYRMDPAVDPEDPVEVEEAFLDDLAEAALRQETRWRPTVFLYGQEELTTYFPDGDLRGHRVWILPSRKGGVGELRIHAGRWHSGALAADLIEVTGDLPERDESELLELAAPYLYVAASEHERHVALRGGLRFVSDRPAEAVRVRGRVFHGLGPEVSPFTSRPKLQRMLDELDRRYPYPAALLTVYDGRRDPLGEDKHRNYRVTSGGL